MRPGLVGTCGGEVDHRWATDGQHHSQNQPTSVNDDTSWKLCEIRVFNGNQQRSITVGWHSQGGSAGSNPGGATHITAGQRRCGAGCEHRRGCHFCRWATAVQQQLRLVSQSWRSVRAASSSESKVLSLRTGAFWACEADTWTDKISTARSGTRRRGTETGSPKRDHCRDPVVAIWRRLVSSIDELWDRAKSVV